MKTTILSVVAIISAVTFNSCAEVESLAMDFWGDKPLEMNLDSIPTSKCYQKTIVIAKGGRSELGKNPLVDHQVPCDYEGNDNNWDDDLKTIK